MLYGYYNIMSDFKNIKTIAKNKAMLNQHGLK